MCQPTAKQVNGVATDRCLWGQEIGIVFGDRKYFEVSGVVSVDVAIAYDGFADDWNRVPQQNGSQLS